MTRIAIVTEIPAPFRIPPFNALASRTATRVLFLGARDPQRPYPLHVDELRFDWTILPGWNVVHGERWIAVNRGVVRELRRFSPHVVVLGGWNQPAFWEGLAYARLTRRHAVTWVESTAADRRSGSHAQEGAKRVFLHASRAFIVPGAASRAYLESLGVRSETIVTAPNAVDASFWSERAARFRPTRLELRARLGVEGYCVLTVARLHPDKNVEALIRAVGMLGADAHLVVAGTGPESDVLRRLADDVAPGRVRFLGFVAREALVEWYAAADVFALASTSEQWGMALSEAAAAGLPLVATEASGAARELIDDGVNGFVLASGAADGFTRALDRLARDDVLREAAGRRSAELAASHTPEAWATAVAELASTLADAKR